MIIRKSELIKEDIRSAPVFDLEETNSIANAHHPYILKRYTNWYIDELVYKLWRPQTLGFQKIVYTKKSMATPVRHVRRGVRGLQGVYKWLVPITWRNKFIYHFVVK